MNILIISDAWHPQINGVVRTYEHLSQELRRQGHKCKVIGPNIFPRTMPLPGYDEIKLVLFPYKRMKNIIEKESADYIHIATEGPLGWAARKYCLKHKIAFTTAYHTQFPAYTAKRFAKYLPFLYKPIHALSVYVVRTFHNAANVMFVATPSLEQELKIWGFETPFARLTRGVNLDVFRPLETGENKAFKAYKGPIALYVGRVAIEKNIEAFLNMEWHGTKIIIGDGPAKKDLEEQYTDSVFLGIKTGEDLAHHFRSADIFVFPSKTDTFGIVLIEALASGLAVAGYNVTGPKDIVTQNMLGAITDTHLSEAANKALKAQGTAQERSTFVKANYNWEIMAKQFLAGIKGNE